MIYSINKPQIRFFLTLTIIVILVWGLSHWAPPIFIGRFQTFVTIFLGIFIEAVPFLLAGSIVSGVIETFIDPDSFLQWIPNNPFAASLTGSLLGFAFPVCECGVVPVTRRLYGKGLPLPVGVSFLLAAPVINPIVLASTYTAFGWGTILIGRFVATLVIAFLVGLVFTSMKPKSILRPSAIRPSTVSIALPVNEPDRERREAIVEAGHDKPKADGRWWQALIISGDEFLDMARYLIIGSLLAAAMQTVVPQSSLVALGGGPVLSVVILMLLAFVLSICSTVDSFVALSFLSSFSTGSILSFLVFGPMVDIKSSLMFLGVFRHRVVLLLIALPLFLTLSLGIMVNFYG